MSAPPASVVTALAPHATAKRIGRRSLLGEHLDALRALLAGERVTVEGRYVRLTDDAGLVAVGEARGDELIKPVVGFRG